MRTNIVIDDALMEAAMKAGGFSTKKEAVEEGLRLLARRKAYQDLRALRGKLTWAVDASVDWTTLEAESVAVQDQPAPYAAAASKPSARKRAKP
ncbi:type II toxin-antitoxin system VapB family antitoxin [Pseudacidovorax sp. RU35E]|uniref:type II toxin-antitoxin system VapB family antitoxin n=1 Tax=Pseudacidovorax sp. RU35E TaxID=1907403 RepID=UPI000954772F|nr:type II toxin-antitoxin system VapB family antitoxin [Pseudacidovorax sp. RU35E]SIR68443.1 antitoxin of type II TA system, VapB [Pseudacidovorax sp. RU35E]